MLKKENSELKEALRALRSEFELFLNLREPREVASPIPVQAGESVYARSFAGGPRWKLAEVVKVKGPVSYLVRVANGEVHHRHRNQLRRAWPTEKPSEPLPDYYFRLPPVQAPVNVEPGVVSPSPTPEGPELRRSTRT
ncbi:hypothetical protein MTO96_010147 [Rhipicephalus appendiculatus]